MQDKLYRWRVLSRLIAAAFGGYFVTAALVAVLSLALSWFGLVSRAEAVQAATLCSFLAYLVLVLWVFSTRTARRSWTVLAVVGVILTALFTHLQSCANWTGD